MSHEKDENEDVKDILEGLEDKDVGEGLAGLEEMQFSEGETLSTLEEQERASEDVISKEDVLEEMEIEELPMDDGGNPEIDQELLRELTEGHLRETLDVDFDRAQKGLTSAGERTVFGERIKGDLEKVNVSLDDKQEHSRETVDDTEKDLDELEKSFDYEELEESEEDLEEQEKEKPENKRKRTVPLRGHSIEEDIPEGFAEEEKDNEIIESYYKNLGKAAEETKSEKDMDSLLRGSVREEDWEQELQDLSMGFDFEEVEENKAVVKITTSKKPTVDENVQRFVPETSNQALTDEELEWEEFLNQSVYDSIDEDNRLFQDMPWVLEREGVKADGEEEPEKGNDPWDTDPLNPVPGGQTDEDKQQSGPKERFVKEFNQEQEDAQKDYEYAVSDGKENGSLGSPISAPTGSEIIAASNPGTEPPPGKKDTVKKQAGSLNTPGSYLVPVSFQGKKKGPSKENGKVVKEFNQSQEDAQKDYENAIMEGENNSPIDVLLADAVAQSFKSRGRNAGGFFRTDSEYTKGFHEGRKDRGEKAFSEKKTDQKGFRFSGGGPKAGMGKEGTDSSHNHSGDAGFKTDTESSGNSEQRYSSDWDSEGHFRRGSFDYDKAGMFVSVYMGTNAARNIKKKTLRELEKFGRYGVMYTVSSVKGNATADGMVLVGRTLGTYVISPGMTFMAKKAVRSKARLMIRRLNSSDKYDFLHDPKRMGKILKPFVKKKTGEKYESGMENAYLNPTKPRQILEMRHWLKIHLENRDMPTDPYLLKKMLIKNKLGKEDAELVRTYLQLDQISNVIDKSSVHPLNMIRKGYYKLKFSVKTQARRNASQNDIHLLTGMFLANKFAKTAIKAVYRSFRTAVKAAKFLIPRMKRTRRRVSAVTEKFTAGRAPKREVSAPDEKNPSGAFRTAKKSKTKKVLGKVGKGVAGAFKSSSERLTKDASTRAAEKATKTAEKATERAAKATAKMAVKAIFTVVKVIINILISVMALLGPIVIVAIFCFVIFLSFESIFGLDKGTYYEAVEQSEKTEGEKLASNEKNVQQYADVLAECRKEFKKNMEEIYEFDDFETINVNYQERRRNGVTKIYEESAEISNDIVTGDNTKEIIAMTCTLFDLNLEDYVTDDEDYGWFGDALNLTRTTKKDTAKLEEFFKKIGGDPEQANKTNYKKIIRSYLMALYNGSHTVSKMIEETHCSGCVATDEIVQDSNGDFVLDSDGNPTYVMECPGHKHLYLTVTTYYFDDIFGCKLKQKNDLVEIIKELKRDTTPDISLDTEDLGISGSIDVSGSNTIEKLWNGLKSQNYSDEAAAGIIGNLMWESGGGPNDVKLNAVQTGGSGIGMCQWSNNLDGSGGRREQFLSFISQPGRDINNASDQLEFMLYELQNGQWLWPSGSGYSYDPRLNIPLSEFKRCTDVKVATGSFCAKFERCFTHNAHMEERLSYAQNVYNTYHGKKSIQIG